MKTIFTLCSFFLFLSIGNDLSATTYTTTGNGNINSASIWSPSAPSSPLADGDEMIINHDVILNTDFTVFGTMTINSGASLIGTNKKLKIGDGSTTGALINNGTIDIQELKVKGDNTVANATAPSVANNATITVDKMHVGDNSAAGILTNAFGAEITVNGELHLDNILDNIGRITVTGKLKNHGGTIKGGGRIVNCDVEFEENNTRPGTILFQDICCDFTASTEPDYAVKNGPTYSTLDAFVGAEGLSSVDHLIDGVEFYSCGINSEGNGLPVELTSFAVVENDQHYAVLTWVTETEIDNQHFEIERSVDGEHFEALGIVNGAGSTNETQYYDFIDRLPIPFAYYRLKQFDFNGSISFSEIKVLQMKSAKPIRLDVFPTVVEQELTLRFNTLNTRKSILTISNSFGNVQYNEAIYSSNQLEYRTLDLANYENGIYFVTLNNGKEYYTTRFVVSKTY